MASHDRPLYLHISALSPDEYDLYTNVLTELAGPGQDDSVWDRPVDVMEARGWIRGRYGLDASMVDKILRYFPASSTGRTEVLSAGHFFAVMRLVLHVQAGREPAKTLVFVQPTVSSISNDGSSPVRPPPPRKQSLTGRAPPSKPPTISNTTPNRARGPSDPTRHAHNLNDDNSAPATPPVPRSANPFRRTISSAPSPNPPSPEFTDATPLSANNLLNNEPPPVHPLSRSAHALQPPTPLPPLPASAPADVDYDRNSDTAGAAAVGNAAGVGRSTSRSKPNPNNPFGGGAAHAAPAGPPVVPPRRPPALPPRQSDTVPLVNLNVLSPSLPPRPTLKPTNTYAGPAPPPISSSMLIKESLRAAKGAQAQRAGETLLEKTLNWEVIKRSGSREGAGPTSGNAGSSGAGPSGGPMRRGGSTSPTRPGGARRPAPSPPASASSIEVMATTRLPFIPTFTNPSVARTHRSDSPPAMSVMTSASAPGYPFSDPPQYDGSGPGSTTPGGGPSTPGSLGKLGRSKSLHQTSPSASATMYSPQAQQAPPPPPRRPRPESFQALSQSQAFLPSNGHHYQQASSRSSPPTAGAQNTGPLSRRASMQSSVDGGSGPAKEKEGSGAGDAFAHLYESVKKKAGDLQKNAQPGLESVRRMAERAESRVVPGGYARHPTGGGEKRGLFARDEDDGDDGSGGLGTDVDPSVDAGEDWSEWDRTVRNRDGRRGRQRLSNGVSMDDGDDVDRSLSLPPMNSDAHLPPFARVRRKVSRSSMYDPSSSPPPMTTRESSLAPSSPISYSGGGEHYSNTRLQARHRSPSVSSSLPALSSPSPVSSHAWLPSSSPPASTPPDSPVRTSFSKRRQSPIIHASDDVSIAQPRIRRAADCQGLHLLLLALESESCGTAIVEPRKRRRDFTPEPLASTRSNELHISTVPDVKIEQDEDVDVSTFDVSESQHNHRSSEIIIDELPSAHAAPAALEVKAQPATTLPPSHPTTPNPSRNSIRPCQNYHEEDTVEVVLDSPGRPMTSGSESLLASLSSRPVVSASPPIADAFRSASPPIQSGKIQTSPPILPLIYAESSTAIEQQEEADAQDDDRMIISPPESDSGSADKDVRPSLPSACIDAEHVTVPESLSLLGPAPSSPLVHDRVDLSSPPQAREETEAVSEAIIEDLSLSPRAASLPAENRPETAVAPSSPQPRLALPSLPVVATGSSSSDVVSDVKPTAKAVRKLPGSSLSLDLPSSSTADGVSRPRKRQRRTSNIENIDGATFASTAGASTSTSAVADSITEESPIPGPLSDEKKPRATKRRRRAAVDDGGDATSRKRVRKPKAAPLTSVQDPSSASPMAIDSTGAAGVSSATGGESDPCAGLDMPSLLVDALVFGRVSFLSAPDATKALVRDHPYLLNRGLDLDGWVGIVRSVLEAHPFFGRIARSGKDADGKKLEDTYYYESTQDPDRGRAATLAEFAPSRRRKAKMGDRTYFYAPIDMNRWVVAAELGDDA